MARRKTLPESVRAKMALAERLAALRSELYGDRGGPEMARRLGIPVRTWYNYEGGVTVPAEVILKIIELTAVEAGWLLHGEEPKFRNQIDGPRRARWSAGRHRWRTASDGPSTPRKERFDLARSRRNDRPGPTSSKARAATIGLACHMIRERPLDHPENLANADRPGDEAGLAVFAIAP